MKPKYSIYFIFCKFQASNKFAISFLFQLKENAKVFLRPDLSVTESIKILLDCFLMSAMPRKNASSKFLWPRSNLDVIWYFLWESLGLWNSAFCSWHKFRKEVFFIKWKHWLLFVRLFHFFSNKLTQTPIFISPNHQRSVTALDTCSENNFD